jgi:hypothetical protein
LQKLIAKNPDLALKHGLDKRQNLASGGGGFGPVRTVDICSINQNFV